MAAAIPFEECSNTDPVTGCWPWRFSVDRHGYGQKWAAKANGEKTMRAAHVLAWEAARGPVPKGMEIDHLCRNRACCNPDHMEVVTHRENVLRGNSPSARQARQTHCSKEYPLAGENLYTNPRTGRRVCRTCRLETQRRIRRQHRNR